MRWALLACFVVLAFGTPCPIATKCAGGDTAGTICTHCYDRSALNDVYNALTPSGWAVNDGWDVSTSGGYFVSDPCNGQLTGREWFGVFCVTDQKVGQIGYVYQTTGSSPVTGLAYRVKTLALANNRLNGNFPTSIYGLTALTELFMTGNPNLRGSLGAGIETMVLLRQLQVDNCGLSGSLPTGLGLLINVQKLYIQNNAFTGAIPNLAGMTALADWQLGGNAFTSGLPTYITTMANLAKFDIGHPLGQSGGVTGTVPIQWSNRLSPLRFLDLSNNRLSGVLPDAQLGQIGLDLPLGGLQYFYFQNNQFSCVFPTFLGNVSRGILFNSSGNSFFCPYPDGISPSESNSDPSAPIVDACETATINVMYVNGNSSARTCTRGDPTGCVVRVTGSNFDTSAGGGTCPLVLGVGTLGSGPLGQTIFVTETYLNPSTGGTISSSDLSFDLGGAGGQLVGISAGTKALTLSFKFPDNSLFPFSNGQLPSPVIILGSCQNNCNGTSSGICNQYSETCLCAVGHYGPDCSLQCEPPYVQYVTTFNPVSGLNETTALQCNGNGICGYNNRLQHSVCQCNALPDGNPAFDGLYCERPSCYTQNCHPEDGQGNCNPATSLCVCTQNTYINVSGPSCDVIEVLGDFCGENADTARDLPEGRGVFSYDLVSATYNCTCTDGEWETDVGCEDGGCLDDTLNCDKKIPPIWPIILGCVLAGLVLIAIGIFVFLKIAKFDPEKKRQQMEMQALS